METYQISMRDHMQVKQDPGSSCPAALRSQAGEGTAPFSLDGPEGCFAELMFGL